MIDLFPRPRHLQSTGGSAAADAPVGCARDPQVPAQGYRLRIESTGISLVAADDAGERYGRDTLRQIRSQCGDTLPTMTIEDWPDFPVRGYMLDVSRDRVPTRETLERIVDLLDLLRINHLELYTEHTFAYSAHRTVWSDASPITGDDVGWLDQLCAERGIELAANQNCFGHMGRWLAHQAYRPLAEAADGWTTSWGAHWKAAVLYPCDASFELVRGLFDELLPLFSSDRVNINCDETFELGKGRSAALVAERGRGQVYLDFLLRILDDLHRRGKEVLFWGDIIRQHPELVAQLPRESTTALVWHYEAPIENPALPEGFDEILDEVGINAEVLRGFAGQVPTFVDTGYPFWVCPGTSTWNSLLGRLTNARANLLDAAEVGSRNGAGGYLITDWGDNGHVQPPSASFAPLALGAAFSWCLDTNRDADPAGVLSRRVFDDPTGSLAAGALRAADAYRLTGGNAFNGSPLFYALLSSSGIFGGDPPTAAGIKDTLQALERASGEIAGGRPQCADGDVIQRELSQAIELARLGTLRLAAQNDLSGIDATEWQRAMERAIDEQRGCWALRSRSGGLDDSLAHLSRSL